MNLNLNHLSCENDKIFMECSFWKKWDFDIKKIKTEVNDNKSITFGGRKEVVVPFIASYIKDSEINKLNISSHIKHKKHIRMRYDAVEMDGVRIK
jgi:hypothetical protein